VKQIYTYSSGMGSITSTQNNALAGGTAYSVSKAALDMWTVKLGLQLRKDGKDVVVKALHPGWATVSRYHGDSASLSPLGSVRSIRREVRTDHHD
jgi:NAD(P)-dependent dehydrogenase (short-subunit alcohol dehydrogenase family)